MKKIALTLSGLLVLVGAACSAQAAAQPAAAKPAAPQAPSLTRDVIVGEGDMFLDSSVTTVASGKVTFTVTNIGAIQHEFVIVSGDPTGTKGDEPGRVSEANHIGGAEGPEIGNINPGGTKTLSANFAPGTYTVMCNLPGHYASGMVFHLVVQ
jgi:uncharacterized cupredoxin-like copper-binding protein